MQRKYPIETVADHALKCGVRVHSQARHGGRMHITTPGKERGGGIRRIGWLASTVGTLLLISVGLELLANQVFGPIDVGTFLWALSLGFWAYILGFAGFLILSVQWLVDWRRAGASRMAMNQLPSTESKRWRLKESKLEGPPQILEHAVAPAIPGLSSWDCNNGDETKS